MKLHAQGSSMFMMCFVLTIVGKKERVMEAFSLLGLCDAHIFCTAWCSKRWMLDAGRRRVSVCAPGPNGRTGDAFRRQAGYEGRAGVREDFNKMWWWRQSCRKPQSAIRSSIGSRPRRRSARQASTEADLNARRIARATSLCMLLRAASGRA